MSWNSNKLLPVVVRTICKSRTGSTAFSLSSSSWRFPNYICSDIRRAKCCRLTMRTFTEHQLINNHQSSNDAATENSNDNTTTTNNRRPIHHKVWKAKAVIGEDSNKTSSSSSSSTSSSANDTTTTYWTERVIDQSRKKKTKKISVDDVSDPDDDDVIDIDEFVQKISTQADILGGKMPQRQLGVLHADPVTDMQIIIDNYTVKAVASALRDREDALQQAAILASENKIEELCNFLEMFHPKYVLERRQQSKQLKQHIQVVNPKKDLATHPANTTNHPQQQQQHQNEQQSPKKSVAALNDPITSLHLDASRQALRKLLMRMPRTITSAHTKRAGVCIALCLCNGIPSILLEKRAAHLRNHPNEICLPGGMVCDIQDQTIVSTSIREMKEEIGGLDDESIEVIGILRLNWGEVQHLTGVAVTPVICYLGDLPELQPNPEEVAEVFTIPLSDLVNKSYWIHKESLAPIFVGGPYMIWGLTGYILERLAIELGRLSA